MFGFSLTPSWNPSVRWMAGVVLVRPSRIATSPPPGQYRLGHVLAGLLADRPVVAADEGGVLVPHGLPVEFDDRDPLLVDLRHHGGQRLGLERRDHEQVDLLRTERLDVGDLLVVVALTVGDCDLELGVLLGSRQEIGVDPLPVRLGVVGLRESYGEGLPGAAVLGQRAGRSAGRGSRLTAGRGQRDEPDRDGGQHASSVIGGEHVRLPSGVWVWGCRGWDSGCWVWDYGWAALG